jgi:cullin 3
LNGTVTLIQYLTEKHIFEQYYKQHLAERLLLNKSTSYDAERNMMAKLKTECGCHSIDVLEGYNCRITTLASTL